LLIYLSTSSLSNAVPGIVGGVLGAAVLLGAFFAIAWYNIKTHKSKKPEVFVGAPEDGVFTGNEEVIEEAPAPPSMNYPIDSANLSGRLP
jgi:hypothetical protein